MKKKLFKIWYSDYGKDMIKNLSSDDKDERQIMRTAKNIFSSVYNMFSNEIAYRLENLQSDIMNNIRFINNHMEDFITRKDMVECELSEYKAMATELYDLHREKKIDDEFFEKSKSFYGEKIDELKASVHNLELMIKMGKNEKKELESLLLS